MKTGYLIFAGLYFLGLMIRAVYEHLKKDGRVDPKNRITFTIVFVAMCLLWASWFSMCPLDPLQISMPRALKWTGLVSFLTGMGLAIASLIQLRGVENISRLVTGGLFSKIRHPMYVGSMFWIFGWAIYHGAVISLLLGFVAIGNIFHWRTLEERELEATYGETYLEYRKRTWF